MKKAKTFTELLFEECFLTDKTLNFSGGDSLPEVFIYEKKNKTKAKRVNSSKRIKEKAKKEIRAR